MTEARVATGFLATGSDSTQYPYKARKAAPAERKDNKTVFNGTFWASKSIQASGATESSQTNSTSSGSCNNNFKAIN